MEDGCAVPGYKTHVIAAGVAASGALALGIEKGWYVPAPQMAVVLIAVAVVAALFPDVDTDSKGRRLYYGLLVVVDVALLVRGYAKLAALLGLCAMLPAIDHHRGWTHAWWAMLAVPLPLLVVPSLVWDKQVPAVLPYYGAAVLGYLTHLLLDRRW